MCSDAFSAVLGTSGARRWTLCEAQTERLLDGRWIAATGVS